MSPLQTLAPDQRAVLELLLRQGRSYAELSELLGLSEDAVRHRAHTALAALAPDRAAPIGEDGAVADWILGQVSADEASSTRDAVARMPAWRAWAVEVTERLGEVSGAKVPAVPAAADKPKPKAAAKPKPARPKPPRVTLLTGLPDDLAAALRQHSVVVASIYNPKASDDQIAVAEASAGAALAGVGFVGLSVLDQDQIGPVTRVLGVIDSPAVVIYQRPGQVIGQLHGFADKETVAQAVANAAS
jgi:hypothetical protein